MRTSEHLEQYRRSWREWGIGIMTPKEHAACIGHTQGQFVIPGEASPWDLFCLACDGGEPPNTSGWEHVSVTARLRHGGYFRIDCPDFVECP